MIQQNNHVINNSGCKINGLITLKNFLVWKIKILCLLEVNMRKSFWAFIARGVILNLNQGKCSDRWIIFLFFKRAGPMRNVHNEKVGERKRST